MDGNPTASPSFDNSLVIKTFQPADYVVFCSLFLVSALIGIFFAVKDRKKKDSEAYLLGGRYDLYLILNKLGQIVVFMHKIKLKHIVYDKKVQVLLAF